MLLRRNYYLTNLSIRRRELVSELTEVAIRPYEYYNRGHKPYLISANSDRYSNCVSTSRKYDLVVSPIEIRRIEDERKKL